MMKKVEKVSILPLSSLCFHGNSGQMMWLFPWKQLTMVAVMFVVLCEGLQAPPVSDHCLSDQGCTSHHLRLLHTITHYFTPLHVTLDHFIPLHATSHHYTILQTTSDHYTPLHVTSDHFRPLQISSHHFTPLHTTSNHVRLLFSLFNLSVSPVESSLQAALHQSVFLSAMSPQPGRDLSLCWEQHSKLLPGVAGVHAKTVQQWSIEQVCLYV